MKQQRRRAARAECVIRKCYFKLAWMEQSQAGLMLIIYYKILSFTLLVLVFLYRNPSLTVCIVWLCIMFGKTIKFINFFVQLILKTLLKLLFLQACVTDKFILFIYLIVQKYFSIL